MLKKAFSSVFWVSVLICGYSVSTLISTNYFLLIDIWVEQRNMYLGQVYFLTSVELFFVILGLFSGMALFLSREVWRKFALVVCSAKIFFYFSSFGVMNHFLQYLELQDFFRQPSLLTDGYIRDIMICHFANNFMYSLHFLVNIIIIIILTNAQIKKNFS